MAKKSERDNRRAIAEQMRKEQARKERRRSMLILGGCIVVVLGLLAAAVIPYVKSEREKNKTANTALAKLGVSAAAAKCSPVQKKKASGNNDHITVGQKIPYTDAPPAFGPHWGNFLQGSEIRPFYTPTDRPPLERMVHSLEHGHTILWYDDTVTKDSKTYKDIVAMAEKLGHRVLLHGGAVDVEGRQGLPLGQAPGADPLDRPGQPAGRHAVLRRRQRGGHQEVHDRLPRRQRPGARRGLSLGPLTASGQVGPARRPA